MEPMELLLFYSYIVDPAIPVNSIFCRKTKRWLTPLNFGFVIFKFWSYLCTGTKGTSIIFCWGTSTAGGQCRRTLCKTRDWHLLNLKSSFECQINAEKLRCKVISQFERWRKTKYVSVVKLNLQRVLLSQSSVKIEIQDSVEYRLQAVDFSDLNTLATTAWGR